MKHMVAHLPVLVALLVTSPGLTAQPSGSESVVPGVATADDGSGSSSPVSEMLDAIVSGKVKLNLRLRMEIADIKGKAKQLAPTDFQIWGIPSGAQRVLAHMQTGD